MPCHTCFRLYIFRDVSDPFWRAEGIAPLKEMQVCSMRVTNLDKIAFIFCKSAYFPVAGITEWLILKVNDYQLAIFIFNLYLYYLYSINYIITYILSTTRASW